MPPHVTDGSIILRKWDEAGLRETTQAFRSLDELFTFCLTADVSEIVDRIVIEGLDESGAPRTLTFVFQSVTVSLKE